MAELRVTHAHVHATTESHPTTGTDLTITLRPGHEGHRTSPDDLPADIRRALLRWLGRVPETEAERHA